MAADAKMCLIEQCRQRREDTADIFRTDLKIALHLPPYPWQGVAKGNQLIEFCDAAEGLPILVIAILLSAPCIKSGRLQMAVFLQTYPDVFVCGRQPECGDTVLLLRLADQRAVR
ncbi:hypothetical protein AJ87_37995 [Rhizobium yanglingense]|nr:hypothetical protein AJ87_37995 [Rhizobium yanglingense]